MKKKLLEASYQLAANKKYKKIKTFFYDLLENQRSVKKRYFDIFMIFLVLTTVFILIYETKNALPIWVKFYEIFALTIFIWEWLARLWVVSDMHLDIIQNYEENDLEQTGYTLWDLIKPAVMNKIKFIFSPLSIIDLLAILPSYRPLRVLRFLLIFRLLKVFRYTENLNYLFRVFIEKKYEFFTIFFIFVFLIFFAGTTIYVFEGTQNDKVSNLFDAMYWAIITISTVGYGDITPVTPEGKFITGFLVITGLVLISFVTSVVTTSMSDRMEFIKESNILHQISKLRNFILICGYGRVAKMLALELNVSHEDIVIVDIDSKRVEEAINDGYYAIRADAADVDFLKSIGILKKVNKAVTLVSDDAVNLSIILAIKSLKSDIKIYSRAVNKETSDKLLIAGADEIIFPYDSAALMAYKYIKKPISTEAISRIVKEYQEPVLDEIEIYEDSILIGKTLSKIGLAKHNLKLIGIIRTSEDKKFYFNPKKEKFRLEKDDILVVIGKRSNIYRYKVDFQSRFLRG